MFIFLNCKQYHQLFVKFLPLSCENYNDIPFL